MSEDDYAAKIKKAVHKSRMRVANNKQRKKKQEEKAAIVDKAKEIRYFHYP